MHQLEPPEYKLNINKYNAVHQLEPPEYKLNINKYNAMHQLEPPEYKLNINKYNAVHHAVRTTRVQAKYQQVLYNAMRTLLISIRSKLH